MSLLQAAGAHADSHSERIGFIIDEANENLEFTEEALLELANTQAFG